MGGLLSNSLSCFDHVRAPTRRILIVGTPGAGKSTVLAKLGKPIGGSRISIYEHGFEMETARLKGLEFGVLDFFDNEEKRRQYRCFFRTTRGIILVLDVSKRASFFEAAKIVKDVFDDDDLFGIPLLVLGNKADLAEPPSETEIVSGLGLNHLHGLEYSVHICAATEADYDTAFYEGLNWLAEQVEIDDELNAIREPFSL